MAAVAASSSSAYHSLLAPPDIRASEQAALDALNASYRSWDSFASLSPSDGVREEAQSKAEALHSQLTASRTSLDAYLQSTTSAAQTHLTQARELALLRHTLSDELGALSSELESSSSSHPTPAPGSPRRSTLLEELEGLHRTLKELGTVRDYVSVISRALSLSEKAVAHLTSKKEQTGLSPSHAAITTYQILDAFVSAVAKTCAGIDTGFGPGPMSRAPSVLPGGAGAGGGSTTLHLISFISGVRERTWGDMKAALATTLCDAAERIGWPGPIDYAACAPDRRREFEYAFAALLKLQDLGDNIPSVVSSESALRADGKSGIYPVQALVTPVALRFKFHFDGSRATNRLDKPEWYFTHVLNAAHEHKGFFDTVIQNILSKTRHKGINAWREFTHMLLPLLSKKLRKTAPKMLGTPALLAHTVYQAIVFDAALRGEGFELAGTSAVVSSALGDAKGGDGGGKKEKGEGKERKWGGISEVVLGREQWFAVWLEGERRFAEDQYHEILNAPDAWLITDDSNSASLGSSDLRPTNSARRLKLLIEQVTDRYSPLPSPSQRTRFLASAQLPLLSMYAGRIGGSLDAFETLVSAFVRAVPGALGGTGVTGPGGEVVDTRRLTSGVEGLMRLGKAWLSAKYVSGAMKSWGDDLFFLELWAEINRSPELRARASGSDELPPIPVQHLRQSVQEFKDAQEKPPESAVFDVLVARYEELASRAEGMMVQHAYLEVEGALRAHLNAASVASENELRVSATLLGPLALLSAHLAFLARTFPAAAVASIYRAVASRLATHLLQRQILFRGRGRLRLDEGKRIKAEAELWVQTCRGALGARTNAARAEAPWRRYLMGARVVGAEDGVWRKVVLLTMGGHDDETWEVEVSEALGGRGLSREDVTSVIRTRVDGDNVL